MVNAIGLHRKLVTADESAPSIQETSTLSRFPKRPSTKPRECTKASELGKIEHLSLAQSNAMPGLGLADHLLGPQMALSIPAVGD